MLHWLTRLFKSKPALALPVAQSPDTAHRNRGISAETLRRAGNVKIQQREFKAPELPPGVVPDSVKTNDKALVCDAVPQSYMALDDGSMMQFYQYANMFHTGLGFPGYPYLAEKSRLSEYRAPITMTATEMTRKWIKLKSKQKGKFVDEIAEIEKAMNDFQIRAKFRQSAIQDGFFGRSQIYVRINGQLDDDQRKLPLLPESMKKGSLLGFQVIEPYWTTPYNYNATDPTDPAFYRPTSWFIMGKLTHDSRLLMFRSNELPDLFKPAYNFSGLSLIQLAEPDVMQWLRARDSVSDLIFNFSTTAIKTNMQAVLAGDSDDNFFKRIELFIKMRSNKGVLALDKDTEELDKINTPLSGLDELQAQAQEHMATPFHAPLVKMFGFTPAGLSSSSEEEIVCWYDWVRASQENLFTDNLNMVLKFIQMHLFGKIHDEIGFDYVELYELDGEALARVRKSDGEAATQYIQSGVLTPEEERERLAADPNSGYNNIQPEDVPDPPPAMLPGGGVEPDDDSEDA